MVQKIGASLRKKVTDGIYALGYFGKVLQAAFFFPSKGKAARKILVMQLLFTFVEALTLTAILAAALGTTIFLIGNSFLVSLGQQKLIYTLLVMIITRELGPLLIAFVVTARSATAIATEIGGMVVSHEIEAYISIGVDPVSHLAAPRFLGVTLSMVLLNIYFSLFGLIVPVFFIMLMGRISFIEYFNNLFQVLTVEVIAVSILKSIIFGMVISVVSTMYGFNVERASTEIPQAGIQAVGKAFLLIILSGVFITVLSYVLK